MEKDKMIMGALIVVILALLVGILVSMPNSTKADSQLEIMGNDTINEEDNLQIKLIDTNGTALTNQTVKITFADKDNSTSDYSVVTNDEGIGELKLDKNAGEYDVTVIYDGNDGYNGCNATKELTIKEKVAEASSSNVRTAYAYKSDGTPMYSQHEVNEYMSHKYGLCDYDIQPNGYIDLKHGESGQYSTNWKDGVRSNGLA